MGSSKPLTGPTSAVQRVMRSMALLDACASPGMMMRRDDDLAAMPLSVIAFITARGVNAPAATALSAVRPLVSTTTRKAGTRTASKMS